MKDKTIKVITLRCTRTNFYNDNSEFHFKDSAAADQFLYVFKDHWCHVSFNKLVEYKRETYELVDELNRDPKKYAESNLNWGFNLAWFHGDDDLTPDEQAHINKLIKINDMNLKRLNNL